MYERRIFEVLWLKDKQLIEHFKMFYNAAKECGSKSITIDLETRSMKMSVDWTIHLFITVIVDPYTFD